MLQNDLTSSTEDIDHYLSLSSIYLSLNARYLAANSSKYAARCELFIQNEHQLLFSNKLPLQNATHKCSELKHKLSHLAQTEFHQIIMWSDELMNENLNLKTNDINQLIQILSLKIQPFRN